ncbi:sigma factor-like helix-turn-helix DNA-binding protein [Streptomyces griseoaurantiacus]|jgi:transcriptional regulator with XRE-family HTH domain|uniref:sigma factor-like helix-turn-helix DNA-binding protein n=1 Tax=Streptomyces griseoaurantiacus TaxID=68213 RepID=UPI0036C18863
MTSSNLFGPGDPAEPPGPGQGRLGRPLGPIVAGCPAEHRAWLELVREAYLESGLTMTVLSGRVHMARSKISELMSGRRYPHWELLLTIAAELRLPAGPLYRLWRQAAPEIRRKSRAWSAETAATVAVQYSPPLHHNGFRDLTESGYRFYAGVFLTDPARTAAVDETYDQLWLAWAKALSSPDIRRHGWGVLRTSVMSRAPHIDNCPHFLHTAFDTLALHNLSGLEHAQAASEQLAETQDLFRAMSRLPAPQLDVIVLRFLGGMTEEEVSDLLGVPLAAVRSDERHATRFLENVLCPPPDTEGTLS